MFGDNDRKEISEIPVSKPAKLSKKRSPDTVTLDADILEKVMKHISQATEGALGIRLTRKDYINWVLRKLPDTLSARDLTELMAKFYDEEAFLKEAMKKIRNARQRGETLTLDQIQAKATLGRSSVKKASAKQPNPNPQNPKDQAPVVKGTSKVTPIGNSLSSIEDTDATLKQANRG